MIQVLFRKENKIFNFDSVLEAEQKIEIDHDSLPINEVGGFVRVNFTICRASDFFTERFKKENPSYRITILYLIELESTCRTYGTCRIRFLIDGETV